MERRGPCAAIIIECCHDPPCGIDRGRDLDDDLERPRSPSSLGIRRRRVHRRERRWPRRETSKVWKRKAPKINRPGSEFPVATKGRLGPPILLTRRSSSTESASRRNALRHGLAIAIGSDPAFHEGINVLAKALMEGRGEHNVGEFARQAAEAEMDLLRIRKLRASRFNAVCGNSQPKLEDHSQLNEELAKLE